MAKKAAKKKKTAKKSAKKKASPLKDHAYKVWLAGLGALSVAEAEGGKLFHQLVEKGTELEKRGKPVVDKFVKQTTEKVADVRKKAGSRAEKVGGEAKAGWTKVEDVVDEKVTATLHKLGIPTRKEIEDLTERVAALTAKLDGKPAARKPAKKAARKPAAKKAVAKKTVRKTVRKPAAKKAVAKKTVRKPAAKKTATKTATPAADA